MIIAVDFDGTIVEHQFPRVGPPVPGAVDWMKRFQELGAKLILWTMRSDGRADGSNPLTDAVEYCRANGIEFWGVNTNPEQAAWTGSPKAYAHVYIDDAAAGTPLVFPHPATGHDRPYVDWEEVGPLVERVLLADRERAALTASP